MQYIPWLKPHFPSLSSIWILHHRKDHMKTCRMLNADKGLNNFMEELIITFDPEK